MMSGQAPKQICSGIEPVDKLLGGLESGQLYLVHGDASGKSLFGIKFLIEGLKRGENGALVIGYSLEDAVRRFARLGYDCLEDMYSGRLVILEYSNEIVHQVARLRALSPVLRELEWELGETKPQRLIFDPVTNLVVGDEGNLESRVQEFAAWARSFGATVALIANGYNEEVIRHFRPLVCQSFRFEVKEIDDRATRFLAFEKAPAIADQPIEVDPSRGLFLLSRADPSGPGRLESGSARQAARADSVGTSLDGSSGSGTIPGDSRAVNEPEIESTAANDELEPLADLWSSREKAAELLQPRTDTPQSALPQNQGSQTVMPNGAGAAGDDAHNATHQQVEPNATVPEAEILAEPRSDLLSDLLDDPKRVPSPLDLDALDVDYFELDVTKPRSEFMRLSATENTVPTETQHSAESFRDSMLDVSIPDLLRVDEACLTGRTGSDQAAIVTEERDSSRKPDSNLAARAVEILLRPPEAAGSGRSGGGVPRSWTAARPASSPSVNPKEFNVLVIDDDLASSESSAQALSEYNVETVRDGISGLAKLISFRPDLVVLNVDLPIVDGFKILAHIRSSLNMPIIIVSGSRVRASDRLLSAELGADYYLTKPFSVKELRHKARQLIARHRGISSWITTTGRSELGLPVASSDAPRSERRGERPRAAPSAVPSEADYFIAYSEFVARVEKGVKAAIDNGASFSVVGCRVPQMTTGGGQTAIRLLEMVRALVRDSDVISTNPHNDIVALLADADPAGARAFVGRLRERVSRELNQEPSLWMRSFPDLEEKVEPVQAGVNTYNPTRRASDRREARPAAPSQIEPSERPESGASYLDFLERKA